MLRARATAAFTGGLRWAVRRPPATLPALGPPPLLTGGARVLSATPATRSGRLGREELRVRAARGYMSDRVSEGKQRTPKKGGAAKTGNRPGKSQRQRLRLQKEKRETDSDGVLPVSPDSQRLSKVLAAAGVASRRAAEELCFEGRVVVNGNVCKLPQQRVNPFRDVLVVDGNVVEGRAQQKYYFVVNKPRGYLCSASQPDYQGKLVLDIMATFVAKWERKNPGQIPPRLFTVGRLDRQTSGLLLITNDGQWANQVAHPSSGLSKEYILTASTVPTKRQLLEMAEGTEVDGVHCKPRSVVRFNPPDGGSNARVLVEVVEGRNREVRVLAESVGLEVRYLKRTRIGGFPLPSDLAQGSYKGLSGADLRTIASKADQGRLRSERIRSAAPQDVFAGE